ncbi:hypothetical protein HN51_024589 [Arachis hypogaea]
MATIIELVPEEYGFVAIVLVIYCFLNLYMVAQVAIARTRYKVPYPTLYASESQNKDATAKLFNCIQHAWMTKTHKVDLLLCFLITSSKLNKSL